MRIEEIPGNKTITSEKEKDNDPITKEYLPNRLKTNVPVIFVSGMAAGWEQIDEPLNILSEEGRHLYAIVHPKKKLADVDIETQKAFSILSLIENKNTEETDLVAASEGALNALIAACLDPQKIRNIVLINPAGLYGKDNRISLAMRSGSEMKRSISKDKDDPEIVQKLESLRKRSKRLMIESPSIFLQELRALTQTDIREMLEYLKKQGIKVSIIQGVDDLLFPMEKTQEYAKVGLIEGFYSVKGGHYNFLTHPQKIMPLVNEALRALEEKLRIEESEEKKNIQKVTSDLETFDGSKKEIEIKLGPDGFPKAVAFFDIDKTLAECGFIHYEAYKKLFSNIFSDEDPDEMARVCLDGISLGTTFRVFHRMIGIYRDRKEEWKDPQKYLEWLPGHEKEVDEEGADHNLAAELSMEGSQIAAEIAEERYRQDPEIFEQAKIGPVFRLAKIYQHMGIPMVVMTANDEPFAKAICKCLGLADSFITLACQKDFVGRGKEGAMEYLIRRLKEKVIPVPKKLIVVGDSLNGDIGSGAKFMTEHSDYEVKGVLVGEGDVEEAKERIGNNSQLGNMSVEILNPDKVGYDEKNAPNLAAYRRKYDTKP